MTDIVEPVLEAAEIIAKKLISEVRFDQTVKATIVNDSNASRGEYLVSTGNATFTAYCADDKYKKDDAVLVTIPEGDYKNQKIIVGKQVDETNSVIHKLSPFQTITDVTGNLISKFDSQLNRTEGISVNMYANGKRNDSSFNYFSWDFSTPNFIASDVYNRTLSLTNYNDNDAQENIQEQFANASTTANDGNGIDATDAANGTITILSNPGFLWDSGEVNYPGYTRLGLQAQFQTWLQDYNIVHGHYGLMLQVQFKILEEQEDKTQKVDYFYKYLQFDCEDFFGNPYTFETYYTQEKIFNLSEFQDYPITRLRLFAYEREDFLTMENIPIEYSEIGSFSTGGPNIFIKDPYICLGFDKESFEGDTALICPIEGSSVIYHKDINEIMFIKDFIQYYNDFYTNNSAALTTQDLGGQKTIISEAVNQLSNFQTEDTNIISAKEKYVINSLLYNNNNFSYYTSEEDAYKLRDKENLKIVELRWIHKDEEKETIKLMANGEIPPHYYIQWYRYKLGAKSPDQFAGAHWVRFYGILNKTNLAQDFQDALDENSNDLNLDSGRTAFQEVMKRYLSRYSDAVRNLNNEASNKETLESILVAADNATNSTVISFYPNANYAEEKLKVIIIKQDPYSNHLSKIAESNVLTFTNQTDVRSEATIIDENALSIKYSDDEKGVYLIYDRSGHIGKEEQGEVRTLTAVFDEDIKNVEDKPDLNNYTSIKWIFPENNTMIIPMADEATTASTNIFENTITAYYTINKNLNRNAINNTVRLEVIKDGLEYTAQVQMIFGTAGTSGSDYTIFIEWQNNQNAIIKRQNGNNNITYVPLNGIIHLMDQSGSLVDNQLSDDLDIQLDWYQLSPTNGNNKSIAKETNLDFKYPIYNSYLLTSADTNLTDFNNNYYITTPYDGTNFYFDMSTGNFSTSLQGQQAYGVVQITDQDNPEANCKNKIIFKPVDEAQNDDVENHYGFLQLNNDNKIIYGWHHTKRLFVKYKDVYIIDPWDSFQEAETYYYPAYSTEYIYSNSSYLTINQEQNNKREFTINVNQDPIDSLHILRVTFNNFGDYQLVALFPIPIKYEMQINDVGNNITAQTLFKVDYINGPTEVRYSTGGEVDFNKNAYEICCRKYNNATGFDVVKHNNESIALPGYWKLLYSINSENNSNIENILPSLAEYINNEGHKQLYTDYRLTKQNDQYEDVEVSFNIPWLQPLGVYYKDAPLYGVQFKTNEAITIGFGDGQYTIGAGTVLWTQPILCYQDNYPSTTLNKWNGKEIQIDNDNGTIVANGMAAGKKESDNTFTGVVMGDWSRTDVDSFISKNTGVYGFNHGAISYAFKDDGTAFLGKDGHGRIYFNGNKATIYSADWIANKNEKNGMLIDVDDAKIEMIGNNAYFTIYDGNQNHVPYIEIGKGKYVLQSSDFKAENSSLYQDGQGIQFNLGTGQITGYNFNIEAKYTGDYSEPIEVYSYTWNDRTYEIASTKWGNSLYGDNRTIKIKSSDSNYPLQIGSKFKVSWSGAISAGGGNFTSITSSQGEIGVLNTSQIYAGTINANSGHLGSLSVTGEITMANGGSISGGTYGANTTGFNISDKGKLQASDVEIDKGQFNNVYAQTFHITSSTLTYGNELGTIGYMQTGLVINGQQQSGVGIGLEDKDYHSKFVISSANAGMSSSNSYVSCNYSDGTVSIGGTAVNIRNLQVYSDDAQTFISLASYIDSRIAAQSQPQPPIVTP